jgi:hypothetical protein
MSTSRDSPSPSLSDMDIGLAMLQDNADFHNQGTQFFDDLKDDEEDNNRVKPGVGEMVKSAWWDAIKYVGQKLAGIFGGS